MLIALLQKKVCVTQEQKLQKCYLVVKSLDKFRRLDVVYLRKIPHGKAAEGERP